MSRRTVFLLACLVWAVPLLATVALAASGGELGGEIGGLIGGFDSIPRNGSVLSMMAVATSASVGTTVWLVKRFLAHVEKSIESLSAIRGEISKLVETLERRPCAMDTQRFRNPHPHPKHNDAP